MGRSFGKLDPRFRLWAEYLYWQAKNFRLRPTVTSTYRSLQEQERLFIQYTIDKNLPFEQRKQKFPVAAPGTSQHNYGLAMDLVSEDNSLLGRIWQSWGFLWGGAKDPIHFGAPSSGIFPDFNPRIGDKSVQSVVEKIPCRYGS